MGAMVAASCSSLPERNPEPGDTAGTGQPDRPVFTGHSDFESLGLRAPEGETDPDCYQYQLTVCGLLRGDNHRDRGDHADRPRQWLLKRNPKAGTDK